MSHRADLPHELAGEAFTNASAREAGVPRSRLRANDLDAPFRGVRAPRGVRASVWSLSRAYLARMPSGHVFSHVTAARLHGLPLPYRLQAEPRLHVTVPAGERPPQITGVVGHELRRDFLDVELVNGIPVTSPLQTWIDLATMLPVGELTAIADFLCAGKQPRYLPSDLLYAVSRLAGRRGCRALRVAAARARARVDSPKETEVRLLIVDSGLPEPVVNFEVTDAAGTTSRHVDLSWPVYRVCVEYEGDEHRTDRQRFRRDITRREWLEDQGWRVIRITDDDLADGGRPFLRRVRAALAARGWKA